MGWKPTESELDRRIASAVCASYNAFVKLWNESENDRSQPLRGDRKGGVTVSFRHTILGKVRSMRISSDDLPYDFLVTTRNWKSWNDGLRGAWKRMPIRIENIKRIEMRSKA